ncbi:MAG: hypothetical protein ABS79_02310 [Planctomycetes bacterium SCN 63-9]|nr:MAG: hypothetical protein ABS79_02310 [Planctomycetes bacterium SCN 63-9]
MIAMLVPWSRFIVLELHPRCGRPMVRPEHGPTPQYIRNQLSRYPDFVARLNRYVASIRTAA